jgi:hypothetical protein
MSKIKQLNKHSGIASSTNFALEHKNLNPKTNASNSLLEGAINFTESLFNTMVKENDKENVRIISLL